MRPKELEESFVTLVTEHSGIIENVCSLYGTAEDRQDLFQEIVYQLWRSYPSFSGRSKPSTWLYRVALNTALTRLRKRYATPEHVALDDGLLKVKRVIGVDDRHQLLQQAIGGLNAVERALVILYLDDLTYKEIADVLGISEVNVGVKLNRIKKKLQEQMGAPQCNSTS